MRSWIFHPLIFYPLVAVAAVLIVAISLQPQSWPRDPAPVSGQAADGAQIYEGPAFNSPDVAATQSIYVTRNWLGQAETLRIAQLPNTPPPGPEEQGARILLSAVDSAALSGRRATIEISYNPLPINLASSLAVSLQGAGPTRWVQQPLAAEPGVLRFETPPANSVNAIGLRAVASDGDQAYGVEITRIRVTPHP